MKREGRVRELKEKMMREGQGRFICVLLRRVTGTTGKSEGKGIK